MTPNEFNKKYGLNESLASSVVRVENASDTVFNDIAGKPKKIVVEIFKRFFSNWVSVLSTILFLFVLIMSIVVSIHHRYTPNSPIWKDIDFQKVIYDPSTHTVTAAPLTVEVTNSLGEKVVETNTVPSSTNINSLPPFYDKYVLNSIWPGDKFYPRLVGSWQNKYDGYLFDRFIKANNAIKLHKYVNDLGNEGVEVFVKPYDFLVVNNLDIIMSYSKIPEEGLTKAEYAKIVDEIIKLNGDKLQMKTILGTNSTGYDIWTSSWIGTWNAIKLAIIVATVQTIIGVAVGSYLGFHVGKLLDTVVMRLINIFDSPPSLIWLLIFVSLFGTKDITLALALIVTGWTGSVGGARMFIITVKDEEYITASKSVGASKPRLIYTHALPAIIGKIATSYVSSIPSIILSVSSLAFLGFFKSTDPNLGSILINSVPDAPNNVWVLLLPSLILLTISISLHFVALGVHDALDPKVIKTT